MPAPSTLRTPARDKLSAGADRQAREVTQFGDQVAAVTSAMPRSVCISAAHRRGASVRSPAAIGALLPIHRDISINSIR